MARRTGATPASPSPFRLLYSPLHIRCRRVVIVQSDRHPLVQVAHQRGLHLESRDARAHLLRKYQRH
jgi:hypothetical protein